jgi:hypothetical protein
MSQRVKRLTRRLRSSGLAAPVVSMALAGCAGHASTTLPSDDAGHLVLTRVDASPPTFDASDAASDASAGGSFDVRVALDASPDAPASRFITEVLSFTLGTCAGWNASDVLATVAGPPVGGGAQSGSLDVVSLGGGGSIVVGFGANAIVDGPGVDFIVFENAFDYGDGDRYVEPGEVSVSDDGVTWTAFPCSDTTQAEPDGGWLATRCAGMNLVFSTPSNGISPFDVAHAGGDAYDLAEIGVTHARYVRIRNVVSSETCPEAGAKPDKNGFDLDAIAIINAALP